MPARSPVRRVRAVLALPFVAVSLVACGVLPFDERPAAGYAHGSQEPLRVAVLDETTGDDWSPAILRAVARYGSASPMLRFQDGRDEAHIVVRVRRYDDASPPVIPGYSFQPGVGGFAAVYDAAGAACNFPPASLAVGCSGEIARVEIYLNDIIPAGADIEARRDRLLLHEMGHALGLTRHSPDLGIEELAKRYGW